MIREGHIDVPISCTYACLNELTPKTKRIWVVFHGYGQLVRYVLRKFEILDPERNYILAPQGLSRFYLEGFNGRVGASWMTSEDRLTDIENQKRYLQALTSSLLTNEDKYEVIVFGFSQGVATACRFTTYTDLKFHKLVLWAGTFPPEIEPQQISHWHPDLEISYFTGNKDPFLKEGMIEDQTKRIKEVTGREPSINVFDGVHELRSELMLKI
ncbi:MAG: alpha/beta hydrolase [Cyclobacteriaceae bacterium]|nr:alpha/beta hydrolase [Cyclobacteriaceae bacterium HetDA_MAG_MS6]